MAVLLEESYYSAGGKCPDEHVNIHFLHDKQASLRKLRSYYVVKLFNNALARF